MNFNKLINRNINLYMLDPIFGEHNKQCMYDVGLVNGNDVSEVVGKYRHGDFGNRVNLESDLKGQTRQLTKCPQKKYNPHSKKYKLIDLPICK